MVQTRVSGPDVSAAVTDALRSVYDPCCSEQGIAVVVDMRLPLPDLYASLAATANFIVRAPASPPRCSGSCWWLVGAPHGGDGGLPEWRPAGRPVVPSA